MVRSKYAALAMLLGVVACGQNAHVTRQTVFESSPDDFMNGSRLPYLDQTGSNGGGSNDGSNDDGSTNSPDPGNGGDGSTAPSPIPTHTVVIREIETRIIETPTYLPSPVPGVQGPAGPAGEDGKDGTDGTDGINGTNGSNGLNGTNGATGASGTNGSNGTNGLPGASGAAGANGTSGTNGTSSSSTSTTTPTTPQVSPSVTPANSGFPAIIPLIIPVGNLGGSGDGANTSTSTQAGRDGRDGRDGQNGKDGCGLEQRTIFAQVQSLDSESLTIINKNGGAKLPYKVTQKRVAGAPTIGALTLDETNAGSYNTGFVNDAQVLFNADLSLPDRRSIRMDKPIQALLNVHVYKSSVDKYLDTEMVCSLDYEICSGQEFTLPGWKKMINPKFGKGKPVMNDYFARQLREGLKRNLHRVGNKQEYWGTISLNLATLFAPKNKALTANEVLNFLYGSKTVPASGAKAQTVNRTHHFLVADDILVGSERRGTSLSLSYWHDTCVELPQ